MKFYIFRHAETYFSKFDIHYGESVESAEIIPEGIPVTERLAKYLAGEDIDAYYTSPFKRCTQTAEIIEKITKMKFIKDGQIQKFSGKPYCTICSRLIAGSELKGVIFYTGDNYLFLTAKEFNEKSFETIIEKHNLKKSKNRLLFSFI